MVSPSIKIELQRLASLYENAEFIKEDPSQFMHCVNGDSNKETIAFIAAALSYGQRSQFLPKINRIVEMSDGEPYQWVKDKVYRKDIHQDKCCYYRLYNNCDMIAFLDVIHEMLDKSGTISNYIKQRMCGKDAMEALTIICNHFNNERRSVKMVPKDTKSSCKRLCMFLRWMVRDNSPVDLGIWKKIIDKRTLIMPMDTHVVQEANKMRLLCSCSTSMASALKLTAAMREVFPDDPLKGDFALFGLGVSSEVK